MNETGSGDFEKGVTMAYKVVSCESKDEWLEERKATIGASDVATVLGINRYKSPYSLWMEKHGDIQPEDLSDNEAVQWGTILEPAIRSEAERRLGVAISHDGDYKILVSDEHPFMSCTLDGYISEPSMYIRDMFDKEISGPGVFEIKTAGRFTREEFDSGGIPRQYQVQVLAQMIVTGYGWGLVGYLLEGRTFGIAPVEWDEYLAGNIIHDGLSFANSLDVGVAPSPDHRDGGTITRMFPEDHGGTIEFTSEFDVIDRKLQELKGIAKDCSIEIKTLEAKIKDAIGEHTFGESPEGVRYSYKQQTRKGHSVSPSTYRVLRRMKG